jgi:hypothetical protein
MSCEIYGGQSGTEVNFLRVLQVPLPFFIPPTALYSLIILPSALSGLDVNSVIKQEKD